MPGGFRAGVVVRRDPARVHALHADRGDAGVSGAGADGPHLHTIRRLPEQVEVSAYYVIAEALTNTAKHAHASAVTVEAETTGSTLRIAVHDNGIGGADFAHGTGLLGLKDRVAAAGGRITLHSPHGAGTDLRVELPLTATTR